MVFYTDLLAILEAIPRPYLIWAKSLLEEAQDNGCLLVSCKWPRMAALRDLVQNFYKVNSSFRYNTKYVYTHHVSKIFLFYFFSFQV